jgi:hypothetical protein
MRSTRLKVLATAALLAGVTAAAGCGDKVIDADKLEKAIHDKVGDIGLADAKVDCPDDVKAKQGGTFECTVTTPDGQKTVFTVTQDDDEGNVHFAPKIG